MSEEHHPDDRAPGADAADHSLADVTTADDCDGDAELQGLRPVIELLDRVGARIGRAGPKPDGLPAEPDVTGLLGDFLIVRVIGRGGMGVVYEAVQKSLNRRVALKILPSTAADDPRKVKRFLIEAQAAACLQHPHIIPVHAVGKQNGLHYFAMRLIEGRTLAEIIAAAQRDGEDSAARADRPGRTPCSPRWAAEMGRQAALALQFAHEQGIIHRDVKPSNLLIDDSGWLWVCDFGLARIAGQADLTVTGAVLGTLRYMSPEQASGARVGVDHRADLYALGATLYELITLRPAFAGDDRLELLRKIVADEPLAPRRIDPAIPRDLETIVRKAIAKDPGDRYPTALELADDLGRFLQDRPILARPPGVVDRATRWVRRHRPAVTAAACVVLLAVVGLVGAAFWGNGVLRGHNRQLRSALERAEANESVARRLWYDSQLRLSQQAWESGQVESAREILEGFGPEADRTDLRGFEWHYLRRLYHSEFSVLSSRDSLTVATAVAVGEGMLVTGHDDGIVVFWDLAAGRERARFRAHDAYVDSLLFSPDGRVLVSSAKRPGLPGQVTLWDPRSARPLAKLPQITGCILDRAIAPDGRTLMLMEHPWDGDTSKNKLVFWNLAGGPEHPVPGAAPVACSRMAYSPNGQWLATSATSGTVTLRDPTNGKAREALPAPFGAIAGLAASPDGRTLAVADSTAMTFWDVPTRRQVGSVPLGSWLDGPQFSPDGNRLVGATAPDSNLTLIADVRTNPRVIPLEKSSKVGPQFAFSPEGRTLAAASVGRTLALWDTSSGRMRAHLPGDTGGVGGLVFAPGGESLIFAIERRPIRSWHFFEKQESPDRLSGHDAEVWGLAYTPDGSTLISSADDHSIKLWDARDGRLRSTLKGHGALVAAVAVSTDGSLLASAGFDNHVRLWDLPGGQPRAELRGHRDRVRTVALSPDGRLVASAGRDRTVRVWNVDRREPITVFDGHTGTVRALAFDPSGARLISASDDQTIRVIEIKGGGQTFALRCPEQNSAVVFSRDGSLLASADDLGNLTIWDVTTWSRRRSVKLCDSEIVGLAFSPDGLTIAAACGDAKVRLVDPMTGQLMLVLEGHARRVNAVAFAPDGSTLASASHDGAVRLWYARHP